MDLPILRSQLQALSISTKTTFDKKVKEFIRHEVDKIAEKVVDAANMGKYEYIYSKKDGYVTCYYLEKYISSDDGTTKTLYSDGTMKKIIVDDLLIALMTKFPDSVININNERIIIDWS